MADCHTTEAREELTMLKTRIVALKYRIGELQPSSVETELHDQVCGIAASWKAEQEFLDTTILTSEDREKLKSVCEYPEFVSLLKQDAYLQERFFVWVLRNDNDPRVLVEFPKMREILRQSLLASRVSRFSNDALVIDENKDLKLLMEGRHVSILNPEKEVTFRGNVTMTIEEIFHVFENKRYACGDFEFLADGVNNYNNYKMGWRDAKAKSYHQIDLTQNEWWKQLSPLETLTQDQITERYAKPCDGKEWYFTANSSRSRKELAPAGFHAYLEVAIPNGDGNYTIYYFGKYPTRFPQTLWEYFMTVVGAHLAVIGSPDENIYYKHRQHTGFTIPATEDEGIKLMESIREDIENGREGKLVFQLLNENCAKWIAHKLQGHFGQERVPDFYEMSFCELRPTGPLGWFFAFMRLFSPETQYKIMQTLAYPFATEVLLNDPPYHPDGTFHHPGPLFQHNSNLE